MYQGGTPQASSVPMTEPALVPTTRSALPGSQPVSSTSAASAPCSQAAPRTPPAPSTSPTRGRADSMPAHGSLRPVPGRPWGMADQDPKSNPTGNAEKDPSEWVTGDESMTGAQASYLKTLCQEAGEDFDESLSKAQASARIDALQTKTGRGQGS